MKSKTYIDRDKINKVRIQFEQKTRYKWYEEIPASVKRWFGIVYERQYAVAAGWSSYSCGGWRETTEEFLETGQYRIDDKAKEIFRKPHVTIHYSGHEIVQWFNTDAEVQEYVDGLVERSKKEFEIIIK
jgi:hypothetical protein